MKNALVISSSYIAAQLMGGGQWVTMRTGPCLNPATAFGLALMQFNFKFPQYLFCPFLGMVGAIIFYEFVFVKTQEYLNEDSEEDEEEEEDEEVVEEPPAAKQKAEVHSDDD